MWLSTLGTGARILLSLGAIVGFFTLWFILMAKVKKLHPGISAFLTFLVIGSIVTWLHLIPAPS